jgi:hypothetical protein
MAIESDSRYSAVALNMAHVRKDTLTAPPEWWKHLRRWNKRQVSKRERRASQKSILTIILESL